MSLASATLASNKISFIKLFPFFMVIFMDVMGVVLVMPVLTPLILQPESGLVAADMPLLWRDFLYGFAIALFPIFMFFSTPILGDLSDKFGRKKILILCLVGSAASYFVSAAGILCNSLTILLLSRVIAGLAAGTQPIAAAAIIDMSSAATKTKHLGWVVFVSSVGVIFGPLLGGVTAEEGLVSWFGYETPFILAGILSLLNALMLWYSFQEKHVVKAGQVIQLTKGFVLFISAFLQKKFRLLACLYFCFILAWGLYFQTINWLFMEYYHYSAGKLGLFVGFIGVVFAFTTSVGMRYVNKLFSRDINTIIFFIFCMSIANFASALSHSEIAQWLWVILNAGGDAICYTVMLSLFSNLVDSEKQGWIMGVGGAIVAITWGVAATISGPLGFIDIQLPLWIAGGILALVYRRIHSKA